MSNHIPSTEELAAEAMEILRRRRAQRTSDEHFTEMVRSGIINAKGEVTRLIGGSADPELNFETWTPSENGIPDQQ